MSALRRSFTQIQYFLWSIPGILPTSTGESGTFFYSALKNIPELEQFNKLKI